MAGILLVVAGGIILGLFVWGIRRLPNTPAGNLFKAVLFIAGFFILLWFVWLAIMVFGVGPAMRNQ